MSQRKPFDEEVASKILNSKKPGLQIQTINRKKNLLKKVSNSKIRSSSELASPNVLSPVSIDEESPVDCLSPQFGKKSESALYTFNTPLMAIREEKSSIKVMEGVIYKAIFDEKEKLKQEIVEMKELVSPPSPLKPRLPSLISNMGYLGHGQQIRSHMIVRTLTFDAKHRNIPIIKRDPMIYWEQKTGIAFCSLNLDYEAINKKLYQSTETLWEVYEKMILKHADPKINSYPFDKWFKLFIEYLPADHEFKKNYQEGLARGIYKIIEFSEEEKERCEFKFHNGKAYVRADHPNRPFDDSKILKDIPLKQQWLLLDTNAFATRDDDERKKDLLVPNGKLSNRDFTKMIYVKNITKNKTYIIFDQPGNIYHSIFVEKVRNSNNDVFFVGKYDAGVVSFKQGDLEYLDNQSGHIRSSYQNFLKFGLCQNIIAERAYRHLNTLIINYKEKGELKTLKIIGNDNILRFFQQHHLFHVVEAKVQSSTKKIMVENGFSKHRDSLTLQNARSETKEIIKMIHQRIHKISGKKYDSAKQPIKTAEVQFLTCILKDYKQDLKRAAFQARAHTSPELFQKFTAKKGIHPESPTLKIIKKIDALSTKDVSLLDVTVRKSFK